MNLRRIVDGVTDVVADLSAKRARFFLMMVAVGLSIGALSTSFGVSRMAEEQIDADLASRVSDRVTVRLEENAEDLLLDRSDEVRDSAFSEQSLTRIRGIAGVRAAGYVNVVSEDASIQSSSGLREDSVALLAVTSGYLDLVSGSSHGTWALDTGRDICFLGSSLASRLGVPHEQVLSGYGVVIDGHTACSVIGVVDGDEVRSAALLPFDYFGPGARGNDVSVHVLTEPGSARPVSRVLGSALYSSRPEMFAVSETADLTGLRAEVNSQMVRLGVAIGLILLILTILLIANALTVAVSARISEIGVRRALGTSRRYILILFISEGVTVGAVGGLFGGAIYGVCIISAALANGWSAMVDPMILILSPLVGAMLGMASSVIPARRASAVRPAEAVRVD